MVKIINVGVNAAAGRIGKLNMHELYLLEKEEIENMGENKVIVSAINDPVPIEQIVHSYQKRDQTHGNLGWRIEKINDEKISINGREVAVFHEKEPSKIPWGDYGVKVVSECSGAFKEVEVVKGHLNGGAERVVISAPFSGVDTTLAMAVNHTNYSPDKHYTISNASCTTKALALPLIALINSGVEIHAVLMDTTHAATNTQRVLQFGSEYGVLNEIITAKTGAAIATSELIPELTNKLDGYALRVPTTDGSFANVFFVGSLEGISADKLNQIFKSSAENPKYLGRLQYFTGQEAGSTDLIGTTASSVIIASKTRVIPLPLNYNGKPIAMCGFCSGYDNERGPARDLAMLVRYVASK